MKIRGVCESLTYSICFLKDAIFYSASVHLNIKYEEKSWTLYFMINDEYLDHNKQKSQDYLPQHSPLIGLTQTRLNIVEYTCSLRYSLSPSEI